MSEKRPAESSTEEPASKKQAITTEMYEEMKAKIAELEKRDIDAQKMTQKQIESFQERTAIAEEKLEMYKEVTQQTFNTHLNYLNSDSKNTLATTRHIFTFIMEGHFIPGEPSSEGIWLHNKQEIFCKSFMKNNKCSICKNNQAIFGYKNDKVTFPFKLGAELDKGILMPKPAGNYKVSFRGNLNTLCKDCILNFKLENTTYVKPTDTASAPASAPTSAPASAPASAPTSAPASPTLSEVFSFFGPRGRGAARGRGASRGRAIV